MLPDVCRLLLACLLLHICAGCRIWQVGGQSPRESRNAPDRQALTSRLEFDVWKPNSGWTPLAEWQNRHDSLPVAEHLRWTPGDVAAADGEELSGEQPSPEHQTVDDLMAEIDESEPSESPATTGDAVERQSSDIEEPGKQREQGSPIAEKPDTASSEDTTGQVDVLSAPQSAEKAAASTDVEELTATYNDERVAAPSRRRSWILGIDDVLSRLDGVEPNAGQEQSSRRFPARRHLSALVSRNDLIGWNAAILWAQRDPIGAAKVSSELEELVTDPTEYDVATGKRVTTSKDSDERIQSNVSAASLIMPARLEAWLSGKTTASEEIPDSKSRSLAMSTRQAAAEAWCLMLAAGADDPADGLAPAGRLLEQPDIPLAVRVELFYGIARWVPPVHIPTLATAFEQSDDGDRAPLELRRAAVGSLLLYAVWNLPQPAPQSPPGPDGTDRPKFDASLWPASHTECEFDSDPQVRQLYGRWLVAANHPRAFETLKSQLLDTAVRVRHGALIELGRLHTESARLELREQAKHPKELIRSQAVRGLAAWGVAEIAEYAADKSFSVRTAVSEELAQYPDIDSARLLWELLIDSNRQVQQAAAESIEEWPDDLAVPLLLHAMQHSSNATRRDCFRKLQKRFPIGENYRFDASREERERAVSQIALGHRLPRTFLERFQRQGFDNASQVDALHVAEVNSQLRQLIATPPQMPAHQAALEKLRELGPDDVPLIEHFLIQDSSADGGVVYREVLPALDPAYEALLDLEHADVFVRRQGARQLADLAQTATLSRLVVENLRSRLIDEQDRWVWRSAMQAVMRDGTEANARIALLAVNHRWPDVRKLGCEYVERHQQPRYAVWLLPLLHDQNRDVQLAAVRAVGNCRNPIVLDGFVQPRGPNEAGGLRALLIHSDKAVQFAAMAGMSRLGDPQGMRELLRLAYYDSPQVRQKAIAEMGSSGQQWFAGHLIELAWTESDPAVKRAVLEGLDLLVSPEKRPAGLLHASGYDAKIKVWAAWKEQRFQPAEPARVAAHRLPLESTAGRQSTFSKRALSADIGSRVPVTR